MSVPTKVPAHDIHRMTGQESLTFMAVLIEDYGRIVAEDVAFKVNEILAGRDSRPTIVWPSL